MDVRTVFLDPIQTAFTSMWQQVGAFIPRFVGALVLLLVGLAVAKLLEGAVVRLLKTVRLDRAAEKLKISEVLMRGGVTLSFSELLGAFVYWFVMFLTLIAALNALNLTVAADLFRSIVAYMPNVVAAMFIFGIGIFFASVLSSTVRAAATNAGLTQANFLSQIVQAVVLIFTALTVLDQLNFRIALLQTTLMVLIASLGLGVAIAIGLGTKDLVGKLVGDWVDRMRSTSRRR